MKAPGPALVMDPSTRETYVLVRKDAYERLAALFAMDEYDPDEGLALINEALTADDAGDPLLESYQRYGKPT